VLFCGLFAGLTILMVRPVTHTLAHAFPENVGDLILYTWSISWAAHALVTNPLNLFDGNIFWPHSLGLAYSDNLRVLLPPFVLVRALGAVGLWPSISLRSASSFSASRPHTR
jgi:hypothetical protein